MTILAWLIMGAVAVAIIGILFSLYFFVQIILQNRKLKSIPKQPPKNKKKRRRWLISRNQMMKRRKRSALLFAIMLLLTAGSGGGAAYINYYQSINLSSEDSSLIVRSYFLLRDFQEELEKAAGQVEDEASTVQNIRYLATKRASYSTKKASQLNTVDGQSTLNRYYATLSEIGVNAARESSNLYGNPEMVTDFQLDIERAIKHETAAFEYFKVNQQALEEEGVSEGQ